MSGKKREEKKYRKQLQKKFINYQEQTMLVQHLEQLTEKKPLKEWKKMYTFLLKQKYSLQTPLSKQFESKNYKLRKQKELRLRFLLVC